MMVRAHSLLYAIYICLIVSLLCGAMLYAANLYNLLNLHYNAQEDLYIHNQSLVNYALGNIEETKAPSEENGIESAYETKPYGLLTLLTAHSVFKNDTVSSVHFAGQFQEDDMCLHVSTFYGSLSYSGDVTLRGNKKLPSGDIREVYIDNKPNSLVSTGTVAMSQQRLPVLNIAYKHFFERKQHPRISLSEIEKINDSIYFNSFYSETKEVELSSPLLSDITIKGNLILHSKDSIRVQKTAVLQDVILIAPTISFEKGFKGNVQVFGTKKVNLEPDVYLSYPSLVCIYNTGLENSDIVIKERCRVEGGIVMFGFPVRALENNVIDIEKNGLIIGDIFSEGVLSLSSDVYGCVYTNKIVHKTEAGIYDNCIADIEINSEKRPDYFVSISLFNENKKHYGLIKKLL